MGVRLGWRSSFGKSGRVVLLRYDMLFTTGHGRPISAPGSSELLHRTRTQHLLLGRACSRQTKLLAHGYPSAIWGGHGSAALIGLSLTDRLPEIDIRPASPCSLPACNGDSPRQGALQHGRSSGHLHRWLRSHSQRRDLSQGLQQSEHSLHPAHAGPPHQPRSSHPTAI